MDIKINKNLFSPSGINSSCESSCESSIITEKLASLLIAKFKLQMGILNIDLLKYHYYYFFFKFKFGFTLPY